MSKADTSLMLCKNGTYSEYKYFGITENLRYIIDVEEYLERDFALLINVDGAEIMRKTKIHTWYILGMVYHTDYKSKPFLIEISYGTSKPASSREFIKDLVEECNILKRNEIQIQNTHFEFYVKAFTCDTLARVYLKQCTGPADYCACERCEVWGEIVSISNNKNAGCTKKGGKRFYNDIDSMERTKESFRDKNQPTHHLRLKIHHY